MVIGMATTQKVTVTLLIEQVEAIRELVDSGKTDSVSGFVQHAVHLALDDVSGWTAMLDAALAETGGPMSREEEAWADRILRAGPPEPGSG